MRYPHLIRLIVLHFMDVCFHSLPPSPSDQKAGNAGIGNASDEEALNILLGGTYNRGADDPTDAEALSILLGGTT